MSITLDGTMDAEGLARRLADPSLGLVRAKGFVSEADGTCIAVQVVGKRWSTLPAPASAGSSGIVCIGPKPAFDHARIEEAIEQSRVRSHSDA